jgi:hypothetical protein
VDRRAPDPRRLGDALDGMKDKWLKAGIFAMALLGAGGIAGIAITGIERVNIGAARRSFHSAWLIEFHWPALLLFLGLLALAFLGTVWLRRQRVRDADRPAG